MVRFRRSHGGARGKGRSRTVALIMGLGILLILLKLGTDQAMRLLEQTEKEPAYQNLALRYQGPNHYQIGPHRSDFDHLAQRLLQTVDSLRQQQRPVKIQVQVPDTLSSAGVANLLRIVQAMDTELQIQTYSTVH